MEPTTGRSESRAMRPDRQVLLHRSVGECLGIDRSRYVFLRVLSVVEGLMREARALRGRGGRWGDRIVLGLGVWVQVCAAATGLKFAKTYECDGDLS